MEQTNQTTQVTKKPKLTKKQQGFVDVYVETGNATEAVRQNYKVKKDLTARVIGSENLTKPNVIAAIEEKKLTLREALEKQGVTPEKIAEKVDVMLNATSIELRKDPQTKKHEFVEVPDYTAIDKGLKHATSIYGVLDPEDKPKSGNTYNFIFSEAVQEKVKDMDATLKAMLTKKHDVQAN